MVIKAEHTQLLILLIASAVGHDPARYAYVQPELHVYENRTGYYFHLERVGWLEASSICMANGSRLARIDDMKKALFIAEVLADSRHEFEDVWLGARLRNNSWVWVQDRAGIPTKTGENGFPPWLRGKAQQSTQRDCLVMDRKSHSEPMFVEITCRMPRHFVCEKSIQFRPTTEGLMDKWKEDFFRGKRYVYYYYRTDFYNSVALCTMYHKSLANVVDIELATHMNQFMYKTRPEFDRVWINGIVDDGRFVWMSTNELITNKTEGVEFPPWLYPVPRPKRDCLLLDSHNQPYFLDDICTRQHFFVCEEAAETNQRLADHVSGARGESRMKDELKYTFISSPKTWKDASDHCLKIGTKLLSFDEPSTKDNIHWIMENMAELVTEMHHSWVDGVRYESEDWKWAGSGNAIPKGDPAIKLDTSEDAGPHLCLNMDRLDHDQSLFFGINCNSKQGFICTQSAENDIQTRSGLIGARMELDSTINPPDQSLQYSDRSYVIKYKKVSFDEAHKICNNSKMALATFDDMDLLRFIVSSQRQTDAGIWIGGKLVNGRWTWLDHKTLITKKRTSAGYPPFLHVIPRAGHDCLSLEQTDSGHPRFTDSICTARNYFVCESKN